MLHNQLPRHQDYHAKKGGAGNQLAVPEGLQQLAGEIGDDESHKGDGPHHGGGNSNGKGHPQQEPPHAFIIVHPQVDSLFLAQSKHVQQSQIPSQRHNQQGQDHQGKDNDLGVHVGKAGHQGGEEAVVLVGVHNAGESGLDAPKERGEHRANQQHIQHVVVGFFEKVAIDHRGGEAHQHQVHSEGRIGVHRQNAAGTRRKHHRCVDEGVQGVHSQQAGGNDGVVDDGLKHQGGSPDGKGGNEHDNEFGNPQTHGVGKVLGVYIYQ